MGHGRPSPAALDPLIEARKRDVDRTLLRENLKLSWEERLLAHADVLGDTRGPSAAQRLASRA